MAWSIACHRHLRRTVPSTTSRVPNGRDEFRTRELIPASGPCIRPSPPPLAPEPRDGSWFVCECCATLGSDQRRKGHAALVGDLLQTVPELVFKPGTQWGRTGRRDQWWAGGC